MSGTQAQKAARKRNWTILRLHSAWHLFREIGCREGQDLVDRELTEMGAKTVVQVMKEACEVE